MQECTNVIATDPNFFKSKFQLQTFQYDVQRVVLHRELLLRHGKNARRAAPRTTSTPWQECQSCCTANYFYAMARMPNCDVNNSKTSNNYKQCQIVQNFYPPVIPIRLRMPAYYIAKFFFFFLTQRSSLINIAHESTSLHNATHRLRYSSCYTSTITLSHKYNSDATRTCVKSLSLYPHTYNT